MKKLLFATLSVFCIFLTGCVKDGDFDALNHDIHVVGTYTPELGIPVGQGEFTLRDLMMMSQATSSTFDTTDHGIITIYYDTTLHTTLNLAGEEWISRNRRGRNRAKDPEVLVQRNPLHGELKIDLFNNITGVPTPENLIIKQMVVDLMSVINMARGEAYDRAKSEYGIDLRFENIRLNAVARDGSLVPIPYGGAPSVAIDEESGAPVHVIDSCDFSGIVNRRPTKITYDIDFVMSMSAPPLRMATMTEDEREEFLHDSVGISTAQVTSDFNLYFPVIAYMDSVQYSMDMPIRLDTLGLDSLYVVDDNSELIIVFENSMPFDFIINGRMFGKDSVDLGVLFPNKLVEGAPLGLMPSSSDVYVAIGTTHREVHITLTTEILHLLHKTRFVRFDSSMSTTKLEDLTQKPLVAARQNDRIKVRSYVKAQPIINIDENIHSHGGGTK